MRSLWKLNRATTSTLTTFLLVFASLCLPSVAAQQEHSDALNTAIADIVPVRDQMESDVTFVKTSKLSAADVKKAQGLYTAAYGKYDAWIQIIVLDVNTGKVKHLQTDTAYKTISKAAAQAGHDFDAYVATLSADNTRTVSATLASTIIDAGVFAAAVKLRTWDEIGSPETKPPSQ